MTIRYARPLVQMAVVITLAMGTGACSTMADLDPTGLLADDTAPLPADDQSAAAPTASDDATTTPDLAAIPVRPPAPDATAQAGTAQSVAAAGAQAQYSADALRAGTEAAAPPPGAAAPVTAAPLDTPPSASDAPPTAGPALAGPPLAAAPPPAAPPARTASAAPPPAAPVAAPEPAPAPLASAPPPPGAEPAVPAVPPNGRGVVMASANPSDAALGFKPSAAPALNPSISQWVSAPILAHYRQTAALAGSAGTSPPAVADAAVPRKGRRSGMGGPAMSGDVVANLDAVPGSPAGMAAAMNGGIPPTAVVFFPGDGTTLSGSAQAQIREAVAAFNANGGGGTVKVVGHASSRTANMPVERHLETIFDKSQKRATVVAQALIKAGIPASKVMVEAVGDSQPVYYESMPKGEDGNRRAEIFVQG